MAATLEQNTLEAQPREAGTKNQARRVRREGKIPAVVYGASKDAVAVSVDPRHVLRILHSDSGHNTIFDLTLTGGEKTKAMIVDWQYEPIKGHLLHIDLKRIAMDKALRVSVPIVLQGTAEGVKTEGGILEQILREVEIECLPGDIPSHIDVDISHLTFGKVLRVSDLPHNPKLNFLSDANQPVAHVTSVKEEVVVTPEAVAAEAGAVPAEPEVIKKGKAETEEEGEAAAEKPEKAEKAEKKAEKKEKK
ncbi:MAG TPA: 50S ribosomal protein L25 [Candidatus Dormibacteraeota bacterium]|jgi:large subunit ribosomal protein L25|nr:50S ribosomal protein L25 [Candidatus Dormibacteraeota bacterium]